MHAACFGLKFFRVKNERPACVHNDNFVKNWAPQSRFTTFAVLDVWPTCKRVRPADTPFWVMGRTKCPRPAKEFLNSQNRRRFEARWGICRGRRVRKNACFYQKEAVFTLFMLLCCIVFGRNWGWLVIFGRPRFWPIVLFEQSWLEQ